MRRHNNDILLMIALYTGSWLQALLTHIQEYKHKFTVFGETIFDGILLFTWPNIDKND